MAYTKGKEYQYKDGKEYIGQYVKLTNGQIYTGRRFTYGLSKRLYPIPDKKINESRSQIVFLTKLGMTYSSLRPDFFDQYKQTTQKKTPFMIDFYSLKHQYIYTMRYFLIHKENQIIYQVNQQVYNNYINDLDYDKYKLKWMVLGDKQKRFNRNLKSIFLADIKSTKLRKKLQGENKENL